MLERFPGDPNIDWNEDIFLDGEVGDYTGGFETASCARFFDDPDRLVGEQVLPDGQCLLDDDELVEMADQEDSKSDIERIYGLDGQARAMEGAKDSYRGVGGIEPKYKKAIKALPPQTSETEPRDVEIVRNLGLVAAIAFRQWPAETLKKTDYFQAGCLGLMKALEKYDPDKSELTVYLNIWLRSEIGREIAEHERTIRIKPNNKSARVRKIDRYVHELTKYSMQMPLEPEELYAAAGTKNTFTHEEAKEYLALPQTRLGLDEIDEPAADEPGYAEIEDISILNLAKDKLAAYSPRKQQIFILCSGIYGAKISSEEIGRQLGLSGSSVNRQYNDACVFLTKLAPSLGISIYPWPQ